MLYTMFLTLLSIQAHSLKVIKIDVFFLNKTVFISCFHTLCIITVITK